MAQFPTQDEINQLQNRILEEYPGLRALPVVLSPQGFDDICKMGGTITLKMAISMGPAQIIRAICNDRVALLVVRGITKAVTTSEIQVLNHVESLRTLERSLRHAEHVVQLGGADEMPPELKKSGRRKKPVKTLSTAAASNRKRTRV